MPGRAQRADRGSATLLAHRVGGRVTRSSRDAAAVVARRKDLHARRSARFRQGTRARCASVRRTMRANAASAPLNPDPRAALSRAALWRLRDEPAAAPALAAVAHERAVAAQAPVAVAHTTERAHAPEAVAHTTEWAPPRAARTAVETHVAPLLRADSPERAGSCPGPRAGETPVSLAGARRCVLDHRR